MQLFVYIWNVLRQPHKWCSEFMQNSFHLSHPIWPPTSARQLNKWSDVQKAELSPELLHLAGFMLQSGHGRCLNWVRYNMFLFILGRLSHSLNVLTTTQRSNRYKEYNNATYHASDIPPDSWWFRWRSNVASLYAGNRYNLFRFAHALTALLNTQFEVSRPLAFEHKPEKR